MNIIGYIFCGIGCVLGLLGEIRLLVAVYHRGVVLFVVCLFIPFALYGFAIAHIRRLWLPFAMSIVGLALLLMGLRLTGCEFPLEEVFG